MLALFALAPLLAAPAAEVEVPPNDGWVTDLAGALSDAQEAELEARMEAYKRGSGHDVAVLLVPRVEGASIERYALDVAREWGLGTPEEKDGALLVVALEQRELRIEVGRGLEGTLTDSIAGRIVRDVIVPEFREGDTFGGVRAGVEAMHAAIGGDYAPLERAARARGSSGGGGGAGVCGLLFLLFFVLPAILGRGRRGRGGDVLPWLLLGSLAASGRRGGGLGGLGGRGGGFGGGGGGGFSGFGGGGSFGGGGASGSW